MVLRAYPLALLLFVGLAAPAAGPVQAQDAPIDTTVVAEDPPTTRDILILHSIYDIESPAFAATMNGANWSSLKVFYSAAPALWLGTLLLDDGHNYKPAYLLTLTEASTVGVVFALKNVIKRPRPYASLSDIAPRSGREPGQKTFDPYSFPSGHAATSFAIATSLSISYPHWYVIAPAVLYATTVTISRPWLGMHYPTDIAVGAALGIGVAFGVHALGELITPSGLTGSSDSPEGLADAPPPPAVRLLIPLGR